MSLKMVKKFLGQLSKRERIVLYLAGVIVVVSLSVSMIFDPLVKRIKELNNDLDLKQRKIQKGERLLQARERIEEEFSKIAEHLKYEGTQEQTISALLHNIEKLSASSGVHITNIKPQRVKESSFYQKMVVEIKLDASIDSIFRFLYDLEASDDFIEINRMQLSTKAQQADVLNAVIVVSKISLL